MGKPLVCRYVYWLSDLVSALPHCRNGRSDTFCLLPDHSARSSRPLSILETNNKGAVVLKVLTLIEGWNGSTGRACADALRKAGHHVQELDLLSSYPQWNKMPLRLLLRILEPWIVDEYNQRIESAIKNGDFDLLLVFKGAYVKPETILYARGRGAKTANYYPDTSLFAWGALLPQTLPLYDILFFTKPFHEKDARARLKIGRCEYLPHGYDSNIHYPQVLSANEQRSFGSDLTFVGTMTPYKEDLVGKILEHLQSSITISIWGAGWSKSKNKKIVKCVRGGPLIGTSYTKAISGGNAALALTAGPWAGASQGDEVTTRSFQIPAIRQVMIHSRNPEILSHYTDGKEILCFDHPEELRDLIDRVLADPSWRQQICEAGYNRAVPSYSYDSRMTTLIEGIKGL